MAYKKIERFRFTYEGEVDENDIPNGKGKKTYDNGTVEEGEFTDGELNGQGKVTWADGDIYEGEFVDGWLNGQGKVTHSDGTVEEGEFVDGELNGQGKITHSNGTVEEGEFVNGELLVETLDIYEVEPVPVDTYDGEKNSHGEPHGKGTMRYADGTVYEGEWTYGQWYGEGIFTDGDKAYRGMWLATKKSNFVTMTENGKTVVGLFRKGQFFKT